MVDDRDGLVALAGDEREVPCLIAVDFIGWAIFLVEFADINQNVHPFIQRA